MENKLPKNWVNAKLNDLSTIQSGGTPSRSNKDYWGGDIPWVKISDLKEWSVNSTTEFITEDGLNNSSTKIFPKGTILFTIFATIGKVGVLNIEACTNQAIAGITPVESIEHKFLTYSLIELAELLKNEGKGVAQKNINLTILKDLNVPLPPLAEQQRIVTKLDALFGNLDTLKTSLNNIPQLLKNFRQVVLTQAVTGKLTEEWRKGKSFNKSNIKEEVNDNYSHYDIPEFWVNSVIQNIGLVKGGKRLPKGDKLLEEDTGYPYIRARDLKKGTVLTDKLMYLSKYTQEKIKRYIVATDDVYITIVGAKIGDAGIVPKEMNGANLTENAAKITELNEELNAVYFSLFLRSSICQSNIQEAIMSAAQGKLALTRIKSLPIYLPPKEEQTEIVKRLEQLFTKADKIEAQYKTLKAKIDSLPQAILAKAFKGELVPQLPTDGDAKELLAEIGGLKMEASKAEKKKVVRKSRKKNPKRVVKKSNPNFPLYSILLNHLKGLTENELYKLSEISQHLFLIQLDKEFEAGMIEYNGENNNLIMVSK